MFTNKNKNDRNNECDMHEPMNNNQNDEVDLIENANVNRRNNRNRRKRNFHSITATNNTHGTGYNLRPRQRRTLNDLHTEVNL